MKNFLAMITLAASVSMLVGCSESPEATSSSSMSLEQAVNNNPARSADNLSRDRHRHPIETLTFFEVEPDMTVVEIWPGGGWYTEILAPYLKENGKLYAAHFPQSETR